MSPGADDGNGDGTDVASGDSTAVEVRDAGSTDETSERRRPDGGTTGGTDAPNDDEVVEAAAVAAEELVFSRLDRSDVEDYDVTVTFEDGVLEVDVYVAAPDADADAEQVADDAALAASGAVDDLFAETGE